MRGFGGGREDLEERGRETCDLADGTVICGLIESQASLNEPAAETQRNAPAGNFSPPSCSRGGSDRGAVRPKPNTRNHKVSTNCRRFAVSSIHVWLGKGMG